MSTDEYAASITDQSVNIRCKPSFKHTCDKLIKEINDMTANFPITTTAKTVLLQKKNKLAIVQGRYLVYCGSSASEAKKQYHYIASHARLQLVQQEISAPWINKQHNKHSLYHSLRKHLSSTGTEPGQVGNTLDSTAITEPVYMLTSFEEGIDLTFDLILDDEDMFDKQDVNDFFQTVAPVPFIITYVGGNSALVPNSKRLAYATSVQTENALKFNPTLLNEISSFDKDGNRNYQHAHQNGDDVYIDNNKEKAADSQIKAQVQDNINKSADKPLLRRSTSSSISSATTNNSYANEDIDHHTSRGVSVNTRRSTASRNSKNINNNNNNNNIRSDSDDIDSDNNSRKSHLIKDNSSYFSVFNNDNKQHHHHHHHHHHHPNHPHRHYRSSSSSSSNSSGNRSSDDENDKQHSHIVEKWKEKEQIHDDNSTQSHTSRHSSLTTHNLRYLREHLRAQQLRRKWRVVFPFISLAGTPSPQSVHMLHIAQAPTIYGQIPGIRVPVIVMAAPNISVWHGAIRSAPLLQRPAIHVTTHDVNENSAASDENNTSHNKHYIELKQDNPMNDNNNNNKENRNNNNDDEKGSNEIVLSENDSVLLADICIDSDDIVYYVEFSIRTQVTGRGGSLCVYSREFLPAELIKYIRPLHLHGKHVTIDTNTITSTTANNNNSNKETNVNTEEPGNIKPDSFNLGNGVDGNTINNKNSRSNNIAINNINSNSNEHVDKKSESTNQNGNDRKDNEKDHDEAAKANTMAMTESTTQSASVPLRTHWEIPIKADVLFNVARALPANASYTGMRHIPAVMSASATNMPHGGVQPQHSITGIHEEVTKANTNGNAIPGAAASYTSQPRFLRQRCVLQVDVRLTSMPYQVFRERFPIVFRQDETNNKQTTAVAEATAESNQDKSQTHAEQIEGADHVIKDSNDTKSEKEKNATVTTTNTVDNNISKPTEQQAVDHTKEPSRIEKIAATLHLELQEAATEEFASEEHASRAAREAVTGGPTRYRLTQVTVTSFAIGVAGVMLTYYQYINDAGVFNANMEELGGVVNGVGFAAHNLLNEYVIVPVKGIATLLKGVLCNSATEEQSELAGATTVQTEKELDFTISKEPTSSREDNKNNLSKSENYASNLNARNKWNSNGKNAQPAISAWQSNDDAMIIATRDWRVQGGFILGWVLLTERNSGLCIRAALNPRNSSHAHLAKNGVSLIAEMLFRPHLPHHSRRRARKQVDLPWIRALLTLTAHGELLLTIAERCEHNINIDECDNVYHVNTEEKNSNDIDKDEVKTISLNNKDNVNNKDNTASNTEEKEKQTTLTANNKDAATPEAAANTKEDAEDKQKITADAVKDTSGKNDKMNKKDDNVDSTNANNNSEEEKNDKDENNKKVNRGHTLNSVAMNELMCKRYPLAMYDVGSTTLLLHRCIRFAAWTFPEPEHVNCVVGVILSEEAERNDMPGSVMIYCIEQKRILYQFALNPINEVKPATLPLSPVSSVPEVEAKSNVKKPDDTATNTNQGNVLANDDKVKDKESEHDAPRKSEDAIKENATTTTAVTPLAEKATAVGAKVKEKLQFALANHDNTTSELIEEVKDLDFTSLVDVSGGVMLWTNCRVELIRCNPEWGHEILFSVHELSMEEHMNAKREFEYRRSKSTSNTASDDDSDYDESDDDEETKSTSTESSHANDDKRLTIITVCIVKKSIKMEISNHLTDKHESNDGKDNFVNNTFDKNNNRLNSPQKRNDIHFNSNLEFIAFVLLSDGSVYGIYRRSNQTHERNAALLHTATTEEFAEKNESAHTSTNKHDSDKHNKSESDKKEREFAYVFIGQCNNPLFKSAGRTLRRVMTFLSVKNMYEQNELQCLLYLYGFKMESNELVYDTIML